MGVVWWGGVGMRIREEWKEREREEGGIQRDREMYGHQEEEWGVSLCLTS